MTSVPVVILGLLRSKPLHGYEIKQQIEEHMKGWTDIKFGSIYFALDKLAQRGFVEVQEEVQEGGRPARTVYRITNRGRIEFSRQLAELWADGSQALYPLDVGLYFIGGMPKEEARKCLEARIRIAHSELKRLGARKRALEADAAATRRELAIISHTAVHLEAELLFLEDLMDHLEEYY